MRDLIELLERIDEFLDQHGDVDDGQPNAAMSLQGEVREVLAELYAMKAAIETFNAITAPRVTP